MSALPRALGQEEESGTPKVTPLLLLTGFLGSGKTTLLNRWLAQAAQQPQAPRIAVLVNDFGAIHIDAALVQQAGSDAIALSNGCVCCAIGDDLSDALQALLQASPPFDAVGNPGRSRVADGTYPDRSIELPWRVARVTH